MWLDVVPDCGPNNAARPLLLLRALQTAGAKMDGKQALNSQERTIEFNSYQTPILIETFSLLHS